MVIDLTLDGLKVPALTGYETKIGTVVKETAENKGRLTAAEVADNIAMPWIRSRPIQVDSDCTLGRADYDARIMAVTPGITITLGSASYVGCTITVYACFEDGVATVAFGSDTKGISAGSSAAFMWNGEKFVLSTFMGATASDASGYSPNMCINGESAWNIYTDSPSDTASFTERGLLTVGAAKFSLTAERVFPYANITGIKYEDFNRTPQNYAVIKLKLNNTTLKKKRLFLLVEEKLPSSIMSFTPVSIMAWGCFPPDENGNIKVDPWALLGISNSGSIQAPLYRDMFNGQGLWYTEPRNNQGFQFEYKWIPFNFDLGSNIGRLPAGIVQEKDGYVYIGLTSFTDNIKLCSWGIADRQDDVMITPADCVKDIISTSFINVAKPTFTRTLEGNMFLQSINNGSQKNGLVIPLFSTDGKSFVSRAIFLCFVCCTGHHFPPSVPIKGAITGESVNLVHLSSPGIICDNRANVIELGAVVSKEFVQENGCAAHGMYGLYILIDTSKIPSDGNKFTFGAVWSRPVS